MRAVALQRRQGEPPEPLWEPHFGVSRSLLHIPLASPPFWSRVGSVSTEAHTHPSLLAGFWHRFRCKERLAQSTACVCVWGGVQDLVASALSADTLPSYWLSQRPHGGLQQAAYQARLAHFTS